MRQYDSPQCATERERDGRAIIIIIIVIGACDAIICVHINIFVPCAHMFDSNFDLCDDHTRQQQSRKGAQKPTIIVYLLAFDNRFVKQNMSRHK